MSTAWVVGASAILGQAVARRLGDEGFTVVGLSRRSPPEGTVRLHVPCDVTDPGSVRGAVEAAVHAHGPPLVLVYAAGEPAMGRTFDVPADAARRAFEVNFWGLEAVVRAAVPEMRAQGGTVVAMLSLAAHRAVPYEAYYAASKAAALRWLDCLAVEVAPLGIEVRHLSPGFIDTGFLERGGWYGMSPPVVHGSGVTPEQVAAEVLGLVNGGRSRVVGWRERGIVWADRLLPGAYDAWLRARRR